MLVRFCVSNFRSFRDEVVLDMLASNDSRHSHHIVSHRGDKKLPLLRTAAIYGANAAGKSNLVEAVHFAQQLILKGTRPGDSIPIAPFKLQNTNSSEGSRFEFTIKLDDEVYTYGFVVNKRAVLEEWLFVEPLLAHKREVRCFERVTNGSKKTGVEIGSSFARSKTKQRQILEFIAEGTRPNQLYLTECYQRNVDKVRPLVLWFRDVLTVINADSEYMNLISRASKEEDFTEFLCNFLRATGTGVEGIVSEEYPLAFETKFVDMPIELRSRLLDAASEGNEIVISDFGKTYGIRFKNNSAILVELKMTHKGKDGKTYTFDFTEESDGTQRLMHLVPMLFELKNEQRVYLIDELDRRLHPLLSRFFLNIFLGKEYRFVDGQIIYTTHDTNLLDQDLLRRDEVWFVEKDDEGASKLYSLSDFNIRPDLKIQKGYLNGRFGAVPFLGTVHSLRFASSD